MAEPIPEPQDGSTVRARLHFSYDGTDFAGWGIQPNLRTVQGVMEAGLARFVRGAAPPRLTVAGRTDAGVHARGQVAHVDVDLATWSRMPGRRKRTAEEGLAYRLGAVLPDDIVISAVDVAPAGFDARFSALERRYAYRIADHSGARDPLTRGYVMWREDLVDVEAVAAASASLLGLRDFTAFCRPRPGATTIRNLMEFSWARPTDGPDAGLLVATVRADAFCHSMVRSLVGAVLAVGSGRRDMDWLATQASAQGRAPGIPVAPPHGLTLEEVTYPPDAEVAARAEEARARRTLD